MAYALRPGIRFCEASGRLVFLDLPGDRYFCLDEAVERRLRQTVLSDSPPHEDALLDRLVHRGILQWSDRPAAPAGPPALPGASTSLLDFAGAGRPPLSDVARAGAGIIRARSSLRRRGMAVAVEAVARRRASSGSGNRDLVAIGRIAAAFARADLYLSPLDQCLPRSLALARALATRRLAGRLVVGVQLRPFLAHSWVQTDAVVLNDRPDVVRTFVPLLVI